MSPFAIPLILITVVWLAIVVLNERFNLLSCDRFPHPAVKWFAYLWLGLFMVGITGLVTFAAMRPEAARDLENLPFHTLFQMHFILMVFLVVWWAISGMQPLKEFLNIRHERPLEVIAIGLAVGVGGWAFTLTLAMIVGLMLQAGGVQPPQELPPMIGWMAALPWWKTTLIVLSAMTVEEFFFRSFLQKRIGLLASTVLFALAHFTYGQPMMLIGVSIISLVIGITFWRTKNVVPGIIAHGVFDAIQIFVIVPFAVKMMGGA